MLKIPFLKPPHYLSKLLKCHSQLVWSNAVDPVRRCQSFWKASFQSHPGYAVYQQHDLNGLGYVIPVLLHGDEGTGSKKQPVSIVSWMTPWGQPGQAAGRVDKPEHFLKRVACALKGSKVSKCCRIPHEAWPKPNDDRMHLEEADFKSLQEQFPAVSGSSYLSHHLVCVLPTYLAKKSLRACKLIPRPTSQRFWVPREMPNGMHPQADCSDAIADWLTPVINLCVLNVWVVTQCSHLKIQATMQHG